ncbi:MAG TPA: entericidin [Phycisphaerales bacterium]|nr:entericidin [Phycisphaerales bacterium]
MNRRVLGMFAVFALCVLCLAGCNTVHGVGTDIQNAADSTQQAIDKVFEGEK